MKTTITFRILLIKLIVKACHSDLVQIFHPFNPAAEPLMPMCRLPQHQLMPNQPITENATEVQNPSAYLKFVLPFLDMEIQYERNLHVLEEVHNHQIFILHGFQLYQMFISRQEKRLSLVATLEGNVRHVEPLAAKIIYLHGNLLVVVALDEHLEVYQLAEDVLIRRAEKVKDSTRGHEPVPTFQAIQQLTLTGKFQELFLFYPSQDRVMIVAVVQFTKLYGKLRIFEWFNTYFDPIEEITVPAMHVVKVVGTHPKYLITGRPIQHKTKTILTVYEISPTSANLLARQTLTVDSRVVHMFTYRNSSIIVACSSKQSKCSSFRQKSNGHFSVYRQRTSNEFSFDLMSSSLRFVSATRQNQVIVFTNDRLDCYGSFISDQIDVTNLVAYENAQKEDYVLLIYKRPFKALVRIVELEINVNEFPASNQLQSDEITASTRHQHLFESTVGQLRSVLLQRKMAMDVFRKSAQILRTTLKDIAVAERITVQQGNVHTIKVIGESLRSPKQIMEEIENLRQTYRSQRSRREILTNLSMSLKKRIKVHTMKVENLIFGGNVIEGFSLNSSNLQQPFLAVKPKVITRFLRTSNLILPHHKRHTQRQQPLYVNQLKVEFINGVPWSAFYNSLFLKNRDNLIQGRLVLQAPVNVNHMTTKILNGFVVANLFNLKYPQIIYSDLILSQASVPNLMAKSVNGLIFEEDIVFNDNDTVIETPVIFHHLNISGDLFLANNTNIKLPPDQIEFKQYYTNKVIVNGSLVLNNLKRADNKTKIVVGDWEFDEKLFANYLLREQDQNFSYPVDFAEAKVTAPHLQTNYLNDHVTKEHLLVDKSDTHKPLLLVFMNAHVQGDLFCPDYKSKIAEMRENIIRPGDKVIITGLKVFEAPLEINNVDVSTFNQLSVEDLVFKSLLTDQNRTLQFKGTKVFTAIKVKNASTIDKELQASFLNNLPLESLLNSDYFMSSLYVPHLLETSNLVFHKINGIAFDNFFSKLDVKDGRLVLHKDFKVEGDVEFAEALELKYINDISWNEYVNSLVRIGENDVIEGDVIFNSDVTVTKAFEVPEINGFDLENILRNVLLKSKPQIITGLYYFDNIYGSNMDVSKVNGVHVSKLLGLSENLTEIEGNIVAGKLNVRGNFMANLYSLGSLKFVKQRVQRLANKPWKNLYVLNNVSWAADITNTAQHELLKYFYKSALKANSDQIITGNVKISQPSIEVMQTRFKFPPNVDIDFILRDSLLRNTSQRQYIKGQKTFLKPIHMEILSVQNHLNTKLLNDIDILRFNTSLYRLSSRDAIQGPLKFLKPLEVGHLQISGLINSLNTSLIYQVYPNSSLPAIELQKLYVEKDLYIKNINNVNLDYFLHNRLTLKGTPSEHFGVLTFENLIIEKEALIKAINGIPIDSMVFKRTPYLQTIMGHKMVQNTLELDGPAHVIRINNKDVVDLYRYSLMKNYNYQFDYLSIEEATFESGLQVANNVNSENQQRSFPVTEDAIYNNRDILLQFLEEFKSNLTNSIEDILYIDFDSNVSIKWLDNRAATVNRSIYFEVSRVSSCKKKYIEISFQYPKNIYLKNITSNIVTAATNEFSVKAENYCKLRKLNVKSKVTIRGQKFLKVFRMERYIESIYTLDLNDGLTDQHFVILHALDLPSLTRNEIRIFQISTQNNTFKDWQSLTQNIGEQLKLYTFSKFYILITNGLVDHYPALKIYHFNYTSQQFNLHQVIDGVYNIMELFELPNATATKHLILSCTNCQRIFIYELNGSTNAEEYEIFQMITLTSRIEKIVTFRLNNKCYMLVLSQRNGHVYYIYKYSYIQGWILATFGYLPNLQMFIPLTELWSGDDSLAIAKSIGSIPLILHCSLDDCHLISGHV